MKQKKALDCFRNKAELIGNVSSLEELYDVLFSENNTFGIEYSTGLKQTRLKGKDAESLTLEDCRAIVADEANLSKGSTRKRASRTRSTTKKSTSKK